MKNGAKIRVLPGLLIVCLVTAGGMVSQLTGYWGGEKGAWNNQFYYNSRIYPMGPPSYQGLLPSIREYQGWQWKGPIYYEFVDTPVHRWRNEEKVVVRLAIAEWNRVASHLQGRILEKGTGECRSRPTDIFIRWEDNRTFFRNWGDPNKDGFPFGARGNIAMFVPSSIAPPFKLDPCADLIAAGFLERGNVIVLNLDASWFTDVTPMKNEEFEAVSRQLCGVPRTVLQARRGGPAYGKWDLFTVAAHEFGHALGLVHSGGCDRKPWTPRRHDLSDDDGSLMWGGPLAARTDHLACGYVGFGERRHVEMPHLALPVKKPDLVVTEITHEVKVDIPGIPFLSPPPGGMLGIPREQELRIYATITNQGSAPAPAFWVQAVGFFGMASYHLHGLVPGSSATIEIVKTTVKSRGFYMVTVTVDPFNNVDEENENNNTLTAIIWLL